MEKENKKEKIISEYLQGRTTYRKLQSKYGIDFRTIHSWVQEYTGKTKSRKKKKELAIVNSAQDLPKEVKQLQEELKRVKLHNQLLEALVDIGKEEFGIDLRKKGGTKQSRK